MDDDKKLNRLKEVISMVDKQPDTGVKSITVNVEAPNGTLIVGDSNTVTTYNNSQIETGTTLSPEQAMKLDKLVKEIADHRKEEVTAVWQKLCAAVEVTDSRFITSELF